MDKQTKERVVAELVERLRTTETLIVADYRGLTMKEIEALRDELLKHGARFTVVKNTLTRRAAEAAGADAVLALLAGPTAIAFLESEGDPVAVAKALGDAARSTRVLAVRGGVLEGRPMTAAEVENLATLPPVDVLRGQVIGGVTAPLYAVVGLFAAPLRDLVGLIDARIEQLGGAKAEAASAEPEEEAPAAEAEDASAEPEAGQVPAAEAETASAEPETEEASAAAAEAEPPEPEAAAEEPDAETTEEAPTEEEQ